MRPDRERPTGTAYRPLGLTLNSRFGPALLS